MVSLLSVNKLSNIYFIEDGKGSLPVSDSNYYENLCYTESRRGSDNIIIREGFADKQKKGLTSDKDIPQKEDEAAKKQKDSGWRAYLGILLTFVASLSFSISILCVKILKDYGVDAYAASFWRQAGITLPITPIFAYYACIKSDSESNSIFDTIWPLSDRLNRQTLLGVMARGLIGSTAVILRFYALQYLTIGDTAVITYSTPALVTFMAHCLLHEKLEIVSVVLSFITLGGVVIVARPPLLTGGETFDTDTLIGTSLAVGSLFCSSLQVVLTRKIRKCHFALVTFASGIIGITQTSILSHTLGHFRLPGDFNESLLTVAVALLSFVGQITMTLALKFEQAGPVALIRSCDIIFGFVGQFIFLGVVPDIYSGVGGAIVLGCVFATGFRKWVKTLPKDNATRLMWNWTLK